MNNEHVVEGYATLGHAIRYLEAKELILRLESEADAIAILHTCRKIILGLDSENALRELLASAIKLKNFWK